MVERNVLGGDLEPCGTEPLTGFFRDGGCRTGPEDIGSHTICAVVTAEFLDHQRSIGNDLSTPRPDHRFPGLVPGDRWCVTAVNWARAYRDGVAAPVVLACTNEAALELLRLHPGCWGIPFQEENQGAARFWRRVATDIAGAACQEERRPVPGKQEIPPDTWLLLSTGAGPGRKPQPHKAGPAGI